jgi:hypothetical protein
MSEREIPDEIKQENEKSTKENPELSPDIIEKIMEKVVDINNPGLGYSFLDPYADRTERLYDEVKNVLHNGLYQWGIDISMGQVKFNITGRAFDLNESDFPIKDNMYNHQNTVGILFDASGFQEVVPGSYLTVGKFAASMNDDVVMDFWKKYFKDLKPGDRRVVSHPKFQSLFPRYLDEYGYPKIDSEWGFILEGGVAKKYIIGVTLGAKVDGQKISSAIVQTNTGELSNCIPVYSQTGSLIWPKQMSYQEVKRSVTEREKIKHQEQEEIDSGSSLE